LQAWAECGRRRASGRRVLPGRSSPVAPQAARRYLCCLSRAGCNAAPRAGGDAAALSHRLLGGYYHVTFISVGDSRDAASQAGRVGVGANSMGGLCGIFISGAGAARTAERRNGGVSRNPRRLSQACFFRTPPGAGSKRVGNVPPVAALSTRSACWAAGACFRASRRVADWLVTDEARAGERLRAVRGRARTSPLRRADGMQQA